MTMAQPLVLRRGVSRLCYIPQNHKLQCLSGGGKVTHGRMHLREQSTVARAAVEEDENITTEAPSPTISRRAAVVRSARPFSDFLTDTFHRQHDYLRISITERCNLRCLYCMPEEGVPLSPPSHLLTTPEIIYLSSMFVSQGVTKIRLTGGEPTVRKDLVPMMQAIGNLRKNGLRELCLTTNGISLHRKLDAMAEAGLTGVNLSLDTLDPFQYQIMTRRNGFDMVMKSIDRIQEMNNKFGAGIKLKINCVVMRGLNDREIIPFVEMGRDKNIEIRFIEYMPFDGNKWSEQKMVPYQEMLGIIRKKYPNLEKVADHKNDTSKTYRVPGFQGRVGFITSMTHNFCGTCNRLRITSDGNLKVCLHGNAEVSLRDLIREDNNGLPIDEEALKRLDLLGSSQRAVHAYEAGEEVPLNDRERKLLDVIGMAVKRKKAKHAGIGELEKLKNRPMILIDKMTSNFLSSGLSLKHRVTVNNYIKTIPTHLLNSVPTGQLQQQQQLRSYSSYARNPSNKSNINNTENRSNQNHPILPHLNTSGHVHMTNVGSKPTTQRYARATCVVHFTNSITYNALTSTSTTAAGPDANSSTGITAIAKGDVFAAARVAGIMAAKKTPDIVPLCHPSIGVDSISIDIKLIEPSRKSAASSDMPMTTPPPEAGIEHETREKKKENIYGAVEIIATVTSEGRTGVEMEAMTAVMGAALTVYDMCKANDKGIIIDEVKLLEKRGGKSGVWRRDSQH